MICHVDPRCHPKVIGDVLKNMQKTSASILRRYMINGNENEAKNEKYIKRIGHKKQIYLNIKCVSV